MNAPRVQIFTAVDEAMGRLGDLATASWGGYATRRGYGFGSLPIDEELRGGRHPSWAKISLLLGCAQTALRSSGAPEILVWVDADSAVVNPCVTIEEVAAESEKPIIVARDAFGPCCGHMIVRPSWESVSILAALWHLGDSDQWSRYHHAPKQEQDTLKVLLEFFPEVRAKVHVSEMEWVCQQGDPERHHLAIHASGPDMEHRWERLDRWAWTGE